jgi:hypothetical protein
MGGETPVRLIKLAGTTSNWTAPHLGLHLLGDVGRPYDGDDYRQALEDLCGPISFASAESRLREDPPPSPYAGTSPAVAREDE